MFDCDNLNDAPRRVMDSIDDSCDQVEPCEFGDASSDITVAFVGDSHALVLKDAMDTVGKQLGWRILSFTKSSCPLVNSTDDWCTKRNDAVLSLIESGTFDLVITAQAVSVMRSRAAANGSDDPERDYRDTFAAIVASGTPVATFRDNPSLTDTVLACARFNFSDPRRCMLTPADGFRNADFAVDAAEGLGLHVIDLSAVFCHDDKCPLVIGGQRVYGHDSHVHKRFGPTLAPLIAADLAGARLIRTE